MHPDLTQRQMVCCRIHMHVPNRIMHRDLKSSNVLLLSLGEPSDGEKRFEKTCQVKLTDFGAAVQMEATSRAVELTAEVGTFRWMAPEVARHEPYKGSADVYSYGMLCFELITHEVRLRVLMKRARMHF